MAGDSLVKKVFGAISGEAAGGVAGKAIRTFRDMAVDDAKKAIPLPPIPPEKKASPLKRL